MRVVVASDILIILCCLFVVVYLLLFIYCRLFVVKEMMKTTVLSLVYFVCFVCFGFLLFCWFGFFLGWGAFCSFLLSTCQWQQDKLTYSLNLLEIYSCSVNRLAVLLKPVVSDHKSRSDTNHDNQRRFIIDCHQLKAPQASSD